MLEQYGFHKQGIMRGVRLFKVIVNAEKIDQHSKRHWRKVEARFLCPRFNKPELGIDTRCIRMGMPGDGEMEEMERTEAGFPHPLP
jgi:hypothetical protein